MRLKIAITVLTNVEIVTALASESPFKITLESFLTQP